MAHEPEHNNALNSSQSDRHDDDMIWAYNQKQQSPNYRDGWIEKTDDWEELAAPILVQMYS